MLHEIAFNKFLKSLENIQFGSLKLTLPNGKQHFFKGKFEGANADLTIYNNKVIMHAAAKGDIGFAEDYRDGKWDSENLSALINFILANQAVMNSYIYGTNIHKLIAKALYFFKSNTLRGSKRNIHAHYDIGNDFYKLWLDETMTYSSAIFNNPNETLAEAQNNKYDRILNLLGDKSANILEIGCGWGGFSERAITQKSHKVKGITISSEQHKYAQNRLANHKQNSNIVIEDYRTQQGKFDHIVSIEMFEAVGEKYWKTYFEKVASLLNQKGRAVVQTITIKDTEFAEYRKSGDMIRSFIFPGGMLPSPSRFEEDAKKAGLKITDKFCFGIDYAKTLEHWLENFDAQVRNVKMLGFDEKFIRIWRLYLATCIASFTIGKTDVMQVELQHG